MTTFEKEANWVAICSGRNLLEEIEELKKSSKQQYEKSLRQQIANEILNPRDEYQEIKSYHGK